MKTPRTKRRDGRFDGRFETWRNLIELTAAVLRRELEAAPPTTAAEEERHAHRAISELLAAGAAMKLSRKGKTAASLTLTGRRRHSIQHEALTISATARLKTDELAYGAHFTTSEDAKRTGAGGPIPTADETELARDAVASIARSAIAVAHGAYDRWLAWRDTSVLFDSADETMRCASSLETGIKTIEEWKKRDFAGGLDALGNTLHYDGCTMHLEYDEEGVLSATAISAPTAKGGHLKPGLPPNTFTSNRQTGRAMIELRRSSTGKTWKPITDRHGAVALMVLERQPGAKTIRRRAAKALSAIARYPEAMTRKAVEACSARTHPTVTSTAWIGGTTRQANAP